MKHDEAFTPKSVEEQIDQFTYSPHQESFSPNAQLIQQLHQYYEEDKRSTERMWERLAQYVAEHDIRMQPVADKPEPLNEVHEERTQSMTSRVLSVRWEDPSRLASLAAVVFIALLVGSLLLVLQMARSSHTGSQPNNGFQSNSHGSSHGLYISKTGEVSKLDPQTRKSVWHTSIPLTGSSRRNAGTLVIIDETVYVELPDHFYALDARDGHTRWSHDSLTVSQPQLVDGLLYVEAGSFLTGDDTLYGLDPADGKIKVTYKAPASGWNSPVVANGLLYYFIDTNLFAIRLSDHKQVWSEQVAPKQQLESLQVKNGLVYAQLMVIQPQTGNYGLIVAYDATTGAKRWVSSAMPGGVRASTITDTTLYSNSIGELAAFDARTGKQFWHQPIDPNHILVDQDTLYISYMTKPIEGSTGMAALNAKDGTILWQASLAWQIADSPLGVQDGVFYTASNNGKNGSIDAFKTSDGSHLWHLPMNGNEWQVAFA